MKLLSAKVITVGLFALACIGIFSWSGIRRARVQARIDVLLPEFEQVSDKFTRPKVFVHKSFKDIPGEGQPRHFACRISAYSDGRFRMPEIVTRKGNDSPDFAYNVVVNLNDTIFEMYSLEEKRCLEFFEFAASLANREGNTLDIRIRDTESKKITPGDYTIKGSELTAFMQTVELTHLFKTVSE